MSEPLLPGAEETPLTGADSQSPPGDAAPRPAKSSWPDILGIIGIILGVLGILNSMGNIVFPLGRFLAARSMAYAAPPGLVETILGFMPPAAVLVTSGLIKLALSILLLAGSVQLKNRNQSGVTLLRLWAIISIPWAVLEMGLAFLIVRAVLPNIPHLHGYGMPTEFPIIAGMTFALLITLAIPVCLLGWFSSTAIRKETAGWQS